MQGIGATTTATSLLLPSTKIESASALLRGRLRALAQERDVLGERVAQVYAALVKATDAPIVNGVKSVISNVVHPADLLPDSDRKASLSASTHVTLEERISSLQGHVRRLEEKGIAAATQRIFKQSGQL